MITSDVAISVEGLGKCYRIGARLEAAKARRQSILNLAAKPFAYLQATLSKPTDEDLVWALKDCSFEVRRGEVLGIVGRNGAGKSTLLKVLSRITEPTKGRAQVHGRVGSLLEVGTGFHPELTGRENIYINGTTMGMRRRQIGEKFDDIVEFSGVERFIDTPVKRYSSGMYMRLAFAVAAHLEPEVLLIDEVLAVGDAEFQKRCLGKMQDVAHAGRTVLFVSHNLQAVKSLCSRAILLDNGQVSVDSTVSHVVDRYLSSQDTLIPYNVWPEGRRPGNGQFRLISARLLDSFGNQEVNPYISEDLLVELQYEVIEQGARAAFSLVLFDSEGYCLFSSLNNTESNFYGKPLATGTYTTTCLIPGNFLNSGRFSITIGGYSANWSDEFCVENAIRFEAVDDGKLSTGYFGKYGGPLKPKLQWTTLHLAS